MANVSVLNTTGQLSGKTLAVCENDQTISGAWTFSGNQSFTGNTTLGNAVGDTITVTGTITSNLIFTDATYDIGASGATRPRDLFLSRNAVVGSALTVNGQTTLTGGVNGALALNSGQVLFPASQNASADANTLDDYEEGAWTPVIGGSGGTSGQTYSGQTGNYVKIGQLVVCTFQVTLSNKGTITGSVQIQGLPFTAQSAMLSMHVNYFENMATNWIYISGRSAGATTTVTVMGTQAAAASMSSMTTADIGNTTAMYGMVVYRASA